MPRMNLEGSSSIITGGASGIGEASARQLAAAGSRVVIADLKRVGSHLFLRADAGVVVVVAFPRRATFLHRHAPVRVQRPHLLQPHPRMWRRLRRRLLLRVRRRKQQWLLQRWLRRCQLELWRLCVPLQPLR